MSLKRVGILLSKELLQGPKNFIFIWAVVAPLAISLIFSLAFGTQFSEKPKLGILDNGSSQLVAMAKQLTSVNLKEYDTLTETRDAVERGAVDVGVVLPADFDSSIIHGEATEVTAYIWGESLAKNRTILMVTITDLIREMAGQEAPIEIVDITLGDEVSIPWSERLLPLVVLMAVFVGGVFLPATSIINEKEKNTLQALIITPTSIQDVFIAKGLLGVMLSLVMGILILIINQAFGTQPLLLVSVLVLGAVMAVEVGLLCGVFFRDITMLFTVWKTGGILLFGPAVIYMFPQIPQWIGHIFPTYYLLQPVVEISQQGGGWSDIALNVFILIGIDVVLIGAIILALKKSKQFDV